MSRKCCCKCRRYSPMYMEPAYMEPSCGSMQPYGMQGYKGGSCCSFSCFIILILILLQFNGRGNNFLGSGDGCDNNNNCNCNGIDKGIIFIIALYYLSCCSPCA